MLKFGDLKVGEVLSESSYFAVSKVEKDHVIVSDSMGNPDIAISKDYAEAVLSSANQNTGEEKISQTELINIVLSNPRTAMSIYFQKANKIKTKKAYKADLEALATKVGSEFMANGVSAIENALANPVLDYVPGEMREIKGYFVGTQDERGRFQFVDMEDNSIMKGVDSRTIEYVIVNNIKYTKKK